MGASAHQRLAAILVADAVGYSRLMEADEHGTVQALDAARATFRQETGQHHGRIVNTAGDSVLAIFETAAGAVGAALAIQKTLEASATAVPADKRLRFRMGIHLGDVIESADGDAYGDGVNIAARLQAIADPGGIVVSDAIRGAVKARVAATFSDLGPQSVKNIADRVRAFAMCDPAASRPARRRPRSLAWAVALVAAVVVLGAIGWYVVRPPAHPIMAAAVPVPGVKPSIAVLPFDNMSGDADKAYFADGMSEDLITDLSKVAGLVVIARNSTFQYKGKARDVREIGKALERALRAGRQHTPAGRERARQRADSSTRRSARTSGRTATTASSRTSSRCRTRSRATSPRRCPSN
jgi:adenylate cyclase